MNDNVKLYNGIAVYKDNIKNLKNLSKEELIFIYFLGLIIFERLFKLYHCYTIRKFKFNMRARYIVLNVFLAQTLILSTLVGLVGVEEYEGGYLWELMCILSPLLLGFQIRAMYERFEVVVNNEI
jgi:hypothetical protein